VATLLFAWAAWNFAVMVGPTFATDCTGECAQNMACFGAQVECPYCDLGIWDSCDMYQKEVFPNTVIMNIGGSRVANFQASIICYQLIDCQNGTYWPFQVCINRWCTLTPAIFQYCLTCAPTGTTHSHYANHSVCTACTEG